jgi:Tol biopolymer transport system component
VTLTPRGFTVSDSTDEAYAWTPDGSTILLASNRNGTWDIFKQRLDMDIAEPFISGPGQQTYPSVTSDGRWVLYVDGTGTDDNILRVPLTGGVPVVVVPHVGRGRLQCAARGGCILVESKDDSFIVSRLHPFDGKGKEPARIPMPYGSDSCLTETAWRTLFHPKN